MARQQRNCVHCGKNLTGRQTKFCSNKCKKAWQEKEKRIGVKLTNEPVEKPQATTPAAESVAKAASTGNRRKALVALRQKLAFEIDQAEYPKDVAVLASRFVDVLDKLKEIDAAKNAVGKPEGALDEFTKRREARRRTGT